MKAVLLFALACALPVCASALEVGPPSPRLQVVFGTTEYQPLRVPRVKAADYVADAPRSVVSAIYRCGGSHTSYREMTDGGAAVAFTAGRPVVEVKACLQKALPQATVEASTFP